MHLKTIAMLVAGIVLVVLPEPTTTIIGLGLLSKAIQDLSRGEDIEESSKVEEPPQRYLLNLNQNNTLFFPTNIT